MGILLIGRDYLPWSKCPQLRRGYQSTHQGFCINSCDVKLYCVIFPTYPRGKAPAYPLYERSQVSLIAQVNLLYFWQITTIT